LYSEPVTWTFSVQTEAHDIDGAQFYDRMRSLEPRVVRYEPALPVSMDSE